MLFGINSITETHLITFKNIWLSSFLLWIETQEIFTDPSRDGLNFLGYSVADKPNGIQNYCKTYQLSKSISWSLKA